MQREAISSYLKNGLEAGYRLADLRGELVRSGWSSQDINDSYRALIPPSRGFWGKFFFFLFLFLATCGGVYFFMTHHPFPSLSTAVDPPEETLFWSTFTSPSSGYSFDIPSNKGLQLTYRVQHDSSDPRGLDYITIKGPSSESYEIQVYFMTGSDSLANWIKHHNNQGIAEPYANQVVGGRTALQVKGSNQYSVYVLDQDLVYDISRISSQPIQNTEEDRIYQHLLDTFQF